MTTAPCPRCGTAMEVDPGIETVCGVCGHAFTPAEPLRYPAKDAPRPEIAPSSRGTPRRSLEWLWWVVIVVLVIPLSVAGILVVSAIASDTATPAGVAATIFSGVMGIVVMVGLVVLSALWITFPVFVYLYLHRILRAIEALRKSGDHHE